MKVENSHVALACAYLLLGLGELLRFVHRGALQGYALSMVIGLAVLLAIWGMVDAS